MERYKTFKEFYPYYLSEHDNKYTKLMHFIGTSIGIFFLIQFFLTLNFINSVIIFIFSFLFIFLIIAMLLSISGLDFLTAISGAASAISNVGPGLGEMIGPDGNYKAIPDLSKWILSFGMLLGRLELFAVLVLFLPSFWRN